MSTADQHIAGAIQADVQDVLPQGNVKPCLDQGVHMNGAVVKDLAHKGNILYLGVVTGDVLDDLIRQRVMGAILSDNPIVCAVDGNAVQKDLLQQREKDAEKLLVYLSVFGKAQTLYACVYVGKAFSGESAHALLSLGLSVEQIIHGFFQLMIIGNDVRGKLHVQVLQRLGFLDDQTMDHVGRKDQQVATPDCIVIVPDLKAKSICQGHK